MKQFFDIASNAGLRRLLLSRMLAFLLVGALVLVMLFKVALPLFVSTASVKLNMERALSSWTGARASIAGDPDISFWPHPVLTLHAVTFEGGDTASPELLAKADAIAAGFDLLAALRGTPVFYDFRLLNPVFKIERRIDGSLNWRRAGWMADAIASASLKTKSSPRNTPIGDIEIENGTLELTDRITAGAYRVTDVSGSIQWPSPVAGISARLSALMNGERVEWSFVCDEPMMLLSGQNSAIQTSFAAAPLSFSFDGTGNASTHPVASGQLQLTANSLPTLIGWYRAATPLPPSTGTISMDTGVTMSAGTLKMDNLSLAVNGSSATGVLDVAWRQHHSPRIDGTLAFERLDLTSVLASFLPAHPASAATGTPDMSFLKQIDLDVRLSAQEASYGAITLTDIAAGVITNKDRASLDIGDSTYFGGSLSGRIALAKDGAKGGQLQFSLKNANLTPVAAGLGLRGPLPLGRGVVSVDLATTEPLQAMTMTSVSGEIHYSASDGALTGFNGPEFERLAGEGGFFNVSQAGDGSFAFATVEIIAKLRGGVAELTKADIRGEGRTLSLAGLIPYRNGSLALAGAFRSDDATVPPVRFFVGGSWPNAIISPLATIPALQ
ncbi:AsmA family protein [Pararhizobium sp. LjRoot255]|uniref:AsmA family protein n=1 Tax=Pararhizobium sp. LjRoot255 TaxID=3342298 RepID=UPI003ECE6EAF